MQNKKSVKDTAFLVLALVVIIGSRFMPAMGGLLKTHGLCWVYFRFTHHVDRDFH